MNHFKHCVITFTLV